jgi:cell division transport system ATP-binding protein
LYLSAITIPSIWSVQRLQHDDASANNRAELGRSDRLINLEGVSYSYGDGDILRDVSLRLAPSSFHFLTGPSGSGKSTFLKLCYAELAPDSGNMQIFGNPVDKMSRDDIAIGRQSIGIVHQNCQFLDHLSVTENVMLPLEVAGKVVSAGAASVDDLIAWVGLQNRANAKPPELSGGERQRLALARAVVMSPDVILADEPTGNVDWEMSLRILQLLIELNKLGKAVMFATHDLTLIRSAKSQVSARVLRLSNKQLHLAGADL